MINNQNKSILTKGLTNIAENNISTKNIILKKLKLKTIYIIGFPVIYFNRNLINKKRKIQLK